MLIQVILTAALAAILAYAQVQRRTSSIMGVLTSVVALGGIGLVWTPSLANTLAHAVGVGRGADLVFYVFIAVTMFICLCLHLRVEATNQTMTEVIRTMALQGARLPAPPEHTS